MLRSGTTVETDRGFFVLLIVAVGIRACFRSVRCVYFEGGVALAATTLNLRITPELNFVKDGSIEHGAKIAKLLEQINKEKEV